ncbi:CGNR zinc finger domain-containing protein [Kribbella sp. NPDC026611]|uniref:CGNR zinc finger domain-containing protein n=1 Tax=Kribbella sp. NPDC026611 TaxID=3154911 RepID=UPI0033C96AB2
MSGYDDLVAETPSWVWLEGHPALDFANTVIRRGWTELELIHSCADLESWLDAATLPAPRPRRVVQADVEAFLALRDPALRLLRAATGHGLWSAADAELVNEAIASVPVIEALGATRGVIETRTLGSPSPFALLLARLAGEVRDALTSDVLALCDAPGCGQLFFRRRPNQAWCGPPCGTRARVARHQQKRPRATDA